VEEGVGLQLEAVVVEGLLEEALDVVERARRLGEVPQEDRRRQEQHPRVHVSLAQFTEDGKSIHRGEVDIQEDQIARLFSAELCAQLTLQDRQHLGFVRSKELPGGVHLFVVCGVGSVGPTRLDGSDRLQMAERFLLEGARTDAVESS